MVKAFCEFNVTVPYTVEAATVEPGDAVFPAAATRPFTAKSVTLVLGVVEVAVTVPVLVEAPVEKPAVKVPVNLPKLAATGLAKVMAADVVPEAMLEKAAATSLGVMLTLAVKVRPLTVTNSFGFIALKVITLFSDPSTPWVIAPSVIELAFGPVAAKSVTLVVAVVEANVTTALPAPVPALVV